MKRVIVFSISVLFLVLSTLVVTKVSAESKLSPSQKQEILKLLKDIEKEKKDIEGLEKRLRDIPKGNDEEYNNIPKVKEINDEAKQIMESDIGKEVDQNYQRWLKTSQTKPFTDFLNQAEKKVFERIMELTLIREEKRENELSDIEDDLEKSHSHLGYTNRKLKKLEDEYGKAAIAAAKGGFVGEKEVKEAAKVSKPGEKISDSTLKAIVYATAKQLGWDKNEDYEMNYLDPAGYGGRFNAHTIQLGGSIGRIGVSYSKYATSKKFAEDYCKAQAKDDYIAKVIEVGPEGKRYDACYFYRNGSSKINNTSIHLMIDKYRLFFDSDDLYWLRTDPIAAINALIGNFLVSY